MCIYSLKFAVIPAIINSYYYYYYYYYYCNLRRVTCNLQPATCKLHPPINNKVDSQPSVNWLMYWSLMLSGVCVKVSQFLTDTLSIRYRSRVSILAIEQSSTGDAFNTVDSNPWLRNESSWKSSRTLGSSFKNFIRLFRILMLTGKFLLVLLINLIV